jgi:hypothetical protein
MPRTTLIAALLCATVATTAAQVPKTPAVEAAQQPSISPLWGGSARWPSDADMHRQFLEHFKSAVGLGRSRMVSPTLRAHDDMRLTITVDDEGSPPETQRYELKRLELIGIARHAPPVAFVIGSHTDRSGVDRTRALTAFEQNALNSFRLAHDVVAETTTTGRAVVGAIHATGECTSCHGSATAGDLLGAFSYDLERLP